MLLNQSRFQDALANSSFAALVATTPQNVEYAASYHSERLHNFVALQSYVVMPPAIDEFRLILPSTEMVHLSSKSTTAPQLARYGTFFVMAERGASFSPEEQRLQDLLTSVPAYPSPIEALVTALHDAGLGRERIGVDEKNLPWPLLEELRQRLPEARIEPASYWFHYVRMVKTTEEIALLQQACRINEEGLGAALEAIRIGATEDEAQTAYRTKTAALGATPRLWGTSSGQNSSCFFWPNRREMRPGDLMRIDCGCTFEGYWADTGITAVAGKPRREHARVYMAVKEAIEAGVATVRPGIPVSAVCETVLAAAHEAGLTDLERHHCGHGIGRELYEPPMLVRAGTSSDIFAGGFGDVLLEENMVVNIEAPYYRLGFGGLHLEHTVLVRSGEPEILTGPRDLVQTG